MNILVTGLNGQLGYDVCRILSARGIENRGVDIEDFDITDADAVNAYIRSYRPDAIIHCSAYTAVDKAEDDAERCERVNAMGPANIAAAANVSRTTLFRIFKSELNTTPVEFLTAYRIAQAKTLLTETELSVTAVARSSGYEDNLYFSRVFRKITGFTPTEYRNCNKNPYE